jgi:hypothetical protein
VLPPRDKTFGLPPLLAESLTALCEHQSPGTFPQALPLPEEPRAPSPSTHTYRLPIFKERLRSISRNSSCERRPGVLRAVPIGRMCSKEARLYIEMGRRQQSLHAPGGRVRAENGKSLFLKERTEHRRRFGSTARKYTFGHGPGLPCAAGLQAANGQGWRTSPRQWRRHPWGRPAVRHRLPLPAAMSSWMQRRECRTRTLPAPASRNRAHW